MAFAKALLAAVPRGEDGLDHLLARLDALYLEARAAAPGVQLTAEAFARFVAARVAGDGEPFKAIARLHLADLYLACACAGGDAAAIQAFRRDLLPRARAAAAKLDRRPEFLQQVEDALIQKVIVSDDGRPPRIGDYAGRGTLASWLCAVAIRAAIDLTSQSAPQSIPLDEGVDHALAKEDPDLHVIRKRYQPAFKRAFERAFALLSAEDRNALRLSVMEKMSVNQLAVMFRVHRSTAARRLARIRQDLLEATRERLSAELRLSERETSSLMRMLRSQLNLSLSRLFAADPASKSRA
jgi:RNA polymerase sigma-70 factor (ECF subfamily)